MQSEYEKQDIEKQKQVMKLITPICKLLDFWKYDYVIENGSEKLILNDTIISCTFDSQNAVWNELIGYIFIKYSTRCISKKSEKAIRKYWKTSLIKE